jgi:Flp pilus assembly protein TadD
MLMDAATGKPRGLSKLEQASIRATLRPQAVVEYHGVGNDQLAEADYRRRLAENPDSINALHALGVLLGAAGRYEEGEQLLTRALRLAPEDPHLCNDLGVTWERAGKLADALNMYRQAARIQPDFHQVWSNLANLLLHTGNCSAAIEACEQALDLQPSYAPALNVLGSALVDIGRPAEALVMFRRALMQWPRNPEFHANYGMALLQCGDFENGWKEHEWRRQLPRPVFRRTGEAWDGSSPAGKTLLVYGEGGLGDVIQFVRYVPILRDRGAKSILVECQRELAELILKMPGVSGVIAPGETPTAYDAHCPLVSLPALLGTRLDNIPDQVPYMPIDPGKLEEWRPVVQRVPGFRVGVCWHGARRVNELRSRSLDPAQLRPLSQLPGVSLINIQHGQSPPADLPLQTLPGLAPDSMRLVDVAAVIHHLDLVVSCDTSIAHLAGALGKPVWVALRHVASWRWMQSRQDSPWYPTMRLFRQSEPDDWVGVFQRMTGELAAIDRPTSVTTR